MIVPRWSLAPRFYRIPPAVLLPSFRHSQSLAIGNADLPDSIVRVPCDHTRDDDAAAVFARIAATSDGLDLLVNSAWGGYERMTENGTFTWTLPFREQPSRRWTSMMDAGVRAA